MKADTRHFLRGPLAAVAAVLMLAMPAYAQSADDPSSSTTSPSQQLESANDQSLSQVPSPIPTVQPQLKPAFWATTAGFEGDTHNTGYAFIGPSYSKPIRRNVSLIGGANVNYLYYQYPSGSDNTMVRSPGVSARGGSSPSAATRLVRRWPGRSAQPTLSPSGATLRPRRCCN